MADPVSIAGLALGIYAALESLVKAFNFAHGRVSSGRKTLREGNIQERAALALLKTWLKYWDIEGENLGKRLDIYWGPEGRIAIIDNLQLINEVVESLKKMEATYSEIISNPSSPSYSPSLSASGGTGTVSAWFRRTGMGIKYGVRDGAELKRLYEELTQKVNTLYETSSRLFKQRHPRCVEPKDVNTEEPNLMAAMIRQASGGLFDELKRSEAVIPSKFELALIRERVDFTRFRDLLLPAAVLRPDTVKFPLALHIDAGDSERDSATILLLAEEMQRQVEDTSERLANWILEEFQLASGVNTATSISSSSFPSKDLPTRRFHRLASDSPTLSYGRVAKVSLRQMIEAIRHENSKPLGYPQKLELAYMLSLSVFQLHRSWTYCIDSSNILIDPNSPFSHFLALGNKGKAVEKELPFDIFRTSQKEVFKLGVVLWEIGLCQTLELQLQAKEGLPYKWEPALLDPMQKKTVADHLIRPLEEAMGRRYLEIVRSCLEVDFGGPSTSQEDFLDVFYEDVVKSLKEMLETVLKPRDRRRNALARR